MGTLKPTPLKMSTTLRVLAHLLGYPGAELRAHLPELRSALHDERALTFGRLAELDALIDRLRTRRALDVEADYVELFDRGRGTALHLFEHVHGDSRDRGPAMVDLVKTYEAAGLFLAPGELPDHLSVVLEYASTQPPEQARAFLGEIAHILQVIFSALLKRQSAHACVLAALLDLAGENAQAVPVPPEPEIDESWEEPLAFGGCSTAGQASPGQPQPVQIVKRAASLAAPQNFPGASA
jgi:nitrate reductase molybdenum cofactor assembly chaperone NarJ/NarW